MRETARQWGGMTPAAFRELPKHEQVEMMAHLREIALRKAHGDHVARIVAEETKNDEPAKKPGRRIPTRR